MAVNDPQNYFNYFTEIEEHFLRRRGGGLLLTTLDWALIETWRDTGVPLEAALQGIDAAFDTHDRRKSRIKTVNSLAYCAKEVLAAAEEMKEAAAGADAPRKRDSTQGFEREAIVAFLLRNAERIESAKLPESQGISVRAIAQDVAATLRRLASEIGQENSPQRLEDLERRLTVLEEKLLAALLTATPDDEVVAVRARADRDLAPYRRNMAVAQIDQLKKQYLHKQLLEKLNLPRLSLFYM